MSGCFITFEGTEGAGKSTQIPLLADFLRTTGCNVLVLREPGGTSIGEEIRHTLKHSQQNHAMTPEAELLLVNASRAQLVREVIRPALASDQVVLCDRFFDSTIAYQGYGRGLDLAMVRSVIEVAVGPTRPDLTFLLTIPLEVSETRRKSRLAVRDSGRDRFEEAGRAFFERVESGYQAIAAEEPQRIVVVDSTRAPAEVESVVRQTTVGWLAKGGHRTSR